jgi:hypothetical protein
MTTRWMMRILWLAGGLALVLAAVREPALKRLARARVLPLVDATASTNWYSGGFRPDGVYLTTTRGLLPTRAATAGSWVDGDQWEGRAETVWFVATEPRFRVGVAGYPQHAGCKLWVEFRAADGTVNRTDCPLTDPREEWNFWELTRPSTATALRIVAEDRSSTLAGWLAFSQPYSSPPAIITAAFLHAQLFTTAALALTLVWGPGLLLLGRCRATELRTVVLLGAGPLLLAGGGVAIWLCGGIIRPQTLGFVLVAIAWIGLGVVGWRRRFETEISPTLGQLLAVVVLVVAAIVAKSSHSVGPEGELFRGTISRNFQVSDRIDSRYSFYVVQVAAHHVGPAAPDADKLFGPWTFFSRGPIAGLTTIPIVTATGGEPQSPPNLPESRWRPFDGAGFAAYRVTMIVLASTVLAALFLVLAPLAGERWALIAAGLVALSPFGLHEMLFTWPKWAATAWLIASFGLAHARRPLGAGLAIGVGYLFHPLVLLWGPWIALWAAGRGERNVRAIAIRLARLGVGAAILVVPWMALGAVMPHLPEATVAGQGGFMRYWARADWQIATWPTWWKTRWMNFANTFIPLHVWLADSSYHHPRFGDVYEPGTRIVKFSFVWWNSLPFAMGLGLWALSLAALVRAFRILRAAAWLLVVAPALFITAYWGMDPLGLMRECGHPLFVTLIALTCLVAAREGGRWQTLLLHRIVPWLQLPETWLMLWLTVLANKRPWPAEYDQLDTAALALNAVALGAATWLLMRARGVPAAAAPTAAMTGVTAEKSWLR